MASPSPLASLEDRLDFISGQIAESVRNVPYRTVTGGNLNAQGNGTVLLFQCPTLATLRLHRVVLQTVGHGPLNPYASITGWVGLFRNDVQIGNLIDFIPAGQTLFPSEFTADTDEAEVLQPNSALWLSVTGGPANDMVIARVQGVFHADYRVQFQASPMATPYLVDEPSFVPATGKSIPIVEPVEAVKV